VVDVTEGGVSAVVGKGRVVVVGIGTTVVDATWFTVVVVLTTREAVVVFGCGGKGLQ
jgi:riboflavin synthase alpha subunit